MRARRRRCTHGVLGDLPRDRLDVSMDGPGFCLAECYGAGSAGLASRFNWGVASHGESARCQHKRFPMFPVTPSFMELRVPRTVLCM